MKRLLGSFAAGLVALFLVFGVAVTPSHAVPLNPGTPAPATYVPFDTVHGDHCGPRWGWYRGFVRRHSHPWFCNRRVIIGPGFRSRRVRRARVIRPRAVRMRSARPARVARVRGARRAARRGRR